MYSVYYSEKLGKFLVIRKGDWAGLNPVLVTPDEFHVKYFLNNV